MYRKLLKKMPFWFWGGIIGVVCFLVLYFVDTAVCYFNSQFCFGILNFITYLSDTPSFIFMYIFGLGYIWSMIIANFIIGACIAHLVKISIKIKKSKGFTIIELLVVIAIIAILSTIVIANVSQYSKKAKDVSAKADLSQIQKLATMYIIENGSMSGLSTSEKVISISDSIKALNPNFEIKCYDVDSSYVASLFGGGSFLASVMVGGPGPGPGNENCSSLGWYCTVSGLENTSGCWCTDFNGVAKDACGNAETCACD